MAEAFTTVAWTADGRRSAVLAEPLALPKYTVTRNPRSRWYSMVSTSPRRTVTVRPRCRLTSASAWLAPLLSASLSALATTSLSSPIREASTCFAATACCCIPGVPRCEFLVAARMFKAPRTALCHHFSADCNSAPPRPRPALRSTLDKRTPASGRPSAAAAAVVPLGAMPAAMSATTTRSSAQPLGPQAPRRSAAEAGRGLSRMRPAKLRELQQHCNCRKPCSTPYWKCTACAAVPLWRASASTSAA